MRTIAACLILLCFVPTHAQTALVEGCLSSSPEIVPPEIHHELVLVHREPVPVISVDSPGSGGLSFEGGTALFVGGFYRIFTTELKDFVHTRIAEWTSPDKEHWTRKPTLFESTGDQTGTDLRAALWSPMMVFDEHKDRWNMFYIGYFSKPNTKERWYENYDGMVLLAVSQTKGYAGIDGPYKDVANLMRPSQESQTWEGLQGTDSFFPYKVGDRWMAFYGSARTEKIPCPEWRVGLAFALSQSGPWTRCPAGNPRSMEKHFIENPIVYRIADGYLAVYDIDVDAPQSIGYALSADGVHWQAGQRLVLWPKEQFGERFIVRTPLGLIPDGAPGAHTYTLFYTAHDKQFKTRTAGTPDFATNILAATVRLE